MARGVDAWLLEAYQEQLSRRPLPDPPGWFYGLFFLTSLGYMSSFTMVGVLISYFNAHYGPSFFVVLSAAFYMPGIGVSYIQKRLDTFLDERLGVQSSFVVRSTACMGGLAAAMLAFPASFVGGGRGPPLMMMFLSGVLTWWSHGTASVVTLLFPPDANVALQTGFRAPELAALPLAIALHIGPASSFDDVIVSLVLGASLRGRPRVLVIYSRQRSRRAPPREPRTSQGRQDAALEGTQRVDVRGGRGTGGTGTEDDSTYLKTNRTYRYCPRRVALLFSLSGAVLRVRQVGGG